MLVKISEGERCQSVMILILIPNTTFYFVNKIFYNKYYCPSCVSLQLVFQDVLRQLHRVLAGAG